MKPLSLPVVIRAAATTPCVTVVALQLIFGDLKIRDGTRPSGSGIVPSRLYQLCLVQRLSDRTASASSNFLQQFV
jgi:hypothetical protein